MEKINCIFCDTVEKKIYLRENGYAGRKCKVCNLIYISPRPTAAEISDLYGHDNAHLSAQDHIKGQFSKRLHAKHNLRLIKKYIKKGTLLEIGSGAGFFLDQAKKMGFEPHGIELNPIQKNFIEKNLKIPCEAEILSEKSFNEKKFDVIYHCDVVSHFYEPIAEFKIMNKKLNENGLLVFETGNLGDIKKKYFKHIKKLQYPDHLFFFSEKNLKDLLEKTGFELVKIYSYSILPQLKSTNFLKRFFGAENRAPASLSAVAPARRSSRVPTKQLVAESVYRGIVYLYHYFIYALRYKVGKMVFKKGRPQTLVVIARRSKNLR
jgi:2-polyprenyl-3-methyl-5-hydroxy-6-metoxy-1,4-benzoquinol methylase